MNDNSVPIAKEVQIFGENEEKIPKYCTNYNLLIQ